MRIVNTAHGYCAAGVLLSFFIGMAVANGFATHEALDKAQGDCRWTLRTELKRQKDRLQGPDQTVQSSPSPQNADALKAVPSE